MNVKHGTESRDWIMVFHCPELLVSHSVATLQLGTSLNLRALLAQSEERKAERGPPGGCARGAASPWRCSPSPCAWPAARAGTGPGWGSRTPHICGPLKQSRERSRSGRARGRAPSTELLGAGPLPRHLPPRAASSLLMRWLRSAVSEAAGTEKGTSSTAYLRAHGAVSGPARGRPATAPPARPRLTWGSRCGTSLWAAPCCRRHRGPQQPARRHGAPPAAGLRACAEGRPPWRRRREPRRGGAGRARGRGGGGARCPRRRAALRRTGRRGAAPVPPRREEAAVSGAAGGKGARHGVCRPRPPAWPRSAAPRGREARGSAASTPCSRLPPRGCGVRVRREAPVPSVEPLPVWGGQRSTAPALRCRELCPHLPCAPGARSFACSELVAGGVVVPPSPR